MVSLMLLAVAVTTLGVAGVADAARNPNADQGGRRLTAVLIGANEVNAQGVPNQGDLDGSGTAVVTLNQGRGTACFELTTTDIATPTRGHIHRGAAGVNGPIVVDFFNDNTTEGPLSGCLTNVDPDLIKDIRQHPDQYYFNVHNTDFSGGAIRGQLSK
jgi:hypothetical protein